MPDNPYANVALSGFAIERSLDKGATWNIYSGEHR